MRLPPPSEALAPAAEPVQAPAAIAEPMVEPAPAEAPVVEPTSPPAARHVTARRRPTHEAMPPLASSSEPPRSSHVLEQNPFR